MPKLFICVAAIVICCYQVLCVETTKSNYEAPILSGYTGGGDTDKLITIVTQPFSSKNIEVKELNIEPTINNIVKGNPKFGFQYVATNLKVNDNIELNKQLDIEPDNGQYTVILKDGTAITYKFGEDILPSDPTSEFQSKIIKTYTVGIGGGDNGDWVDRRNYELIKTN